MIGRLRLNEIAEELGVTATYDELGVQGVAIDSRAVSKGDLFVALKGERFDGHDYVDQAARNGCAAMVLEKSLDVDCPVISVRDTQLALAKIAGLNRRKFEGKVVGITGSTGKTSVKNMLATILSLSASTHATEGNFNNEIGVPLTLLGIGDEHGYAVVEMGARKIGDIEYLGSFVRPDVAAVLNVGTAHIEIFGSRNNIMSAKSEIFDSLSTNGIGVVNLDDMGAEKWLHQLNEQEVVTFSVEQASADVSASHIVCSESATQFDLVMDGVIHPVSLQLVGRHNVVNALAAAACAKALGVECSQIAKGLQMVTSASGRLEFVEVANGARVIDDSYNANPVSMKSAIDALALQEGKKIAVLGEMAELGEHAKSLHLDVAEYVREQGIDECYLVGTYAAEMAMRLGERAKCFETNEELAAALKQDLTGKEVILVKGSRSAGMDEVITSLKGAMH